MGVWRCDLLKKINGHPDQKLKHIKSYYNSETKHIKPYVNRVSCNSDGCTVGKSKDQAKTDPPPEKLCVH